MADEERVIEVEPEPIEAPAAVTEADRWLAEQRERVEARARDFEAFDVTTPEQYRDAKAQRRALRALIKEVDDDKRRMTASLRATLDRFNGEVSRLLDGLRAEDAQYKSEIDRWERRCVLERDARVEARYREEYPDLAAQVPYDRLRARFGAEWRADNYGTREAKVWEGVEAACGAVASELATLRAQTHVNGTELTGDDRRDLYADYLSTLDMASAQRTCIARVEQREALRRAEAERAAWEAEQAAAQAAIDYGASEAGAGPREAPAVAACAPSAAEPVPTPAEAGSGPQAGSQGPDARGCTLVFEVRVPEAAFERFREAMVALGTTGRLLRRE